MEQIFQMVENHGLGFASFIALLWFIFKYQSKNEECLDNISTTLTQIQIKLANMTDRIAKIEEKLNKKEV